jgi:nickel-dependent lactate racemase
MRIGRGPGQLELEIADTQLVRMARQPPAPALPDVEAAVRQALEEPLRFPALRRALTPDDHITIVVDETLADLPRLLAPILEYLVAAHITPDAITLVCQAAGAHPWVEQLPAAFQQVRVEEHDPGERKKVSYLATTRHGRRLYINRSAVDADQLVVLSRRFYDPLLGHGGAEGAIFPALSDQETQKTAFDKLSMSAPGQAVWPLRQEAAEVAWLLGAPFFVQVIEGAEGAPTHILGGTVESSAEGQRLIDAQWKVEIDRSADVVIAKVSGDPAGHDFADLARALACASRVVKPDGRIILLSGGAPELGPGAQLLRQVDTPDEALALLKERKPPDYAAAFQWASTAQRAKVYLVSQLPAEVAEEIFTVPLEHAGQIQRLLDHGSCLSLSEADRSLAVLQRKSKA